MEGIIALVLYFTAYFSIVLFLIGSIIYTTAMIVSALYQAPFVGSRRKLLREVFETLKQTRSTDTDNRTFIDLGSGDGRVVFEAADVYGYKATGFERNPMLVMLSNLIRKQKKSKATFVNASIFDAPFEKADILYCFLLPVLLDKIAPLIRLKARKGTIIVSHGFKIQALQPNLYYTLNAEPFNTYFYRL